ncbi:MAG: hypothetical protein ACRENG_04815 [bacterium]
MRASTSKTVAAFTFLALVIFLESVAKLHSVTTGKQDIAAGRFQNINNVITTQVSVNSISSYEDRPEIRGSGFEESLFIVDGVGRATRSRTGHMRASIWMPFRR